MEPGEKAHNVEHRTVCVASERARIGGHVRAFEHDGADIGMAREERVASLENVALGGGGIESRLVAQNGAAEFTAAIGADDRRVARRAGGVEMLWRERRGADG